MESQYPSHFLLILSFLKAIEVMGIGATRPKDQPPGITDSLQGLRKLWEQLMLTDHILA
jgi:hypothetical protein